MRNFARYKMIMSERTAAMKYPEKVKSLYESAFPPEERRPWPEFVRLAETEEMFEVREVEDPVSGDFVGFVTVWNMPEGFAYVEHFAVMLDFRGYGTGGRIIDSVQSPTVLEVELPDSDDACRRIEFYRRHGFEVGEEMEYVQPSYAPELPEVRMLLMCRGCVDVNKAARRLHETVYGVR